MHGDYRDRHKANAAQWAIMAFGVALVFVVGVILGSSERANAYSP
jgi:hypothetical protein